MRWGLCGLGGPGEEGISQDEYQRRGEQEKQRRRGGDPSRLQESPDPW